VGQVFSGFLIGVGIAFPLACTNIIPSAAFADIAQYDAIRTKESKVAMFIAVRGFLINLSGAVVTGVVSYVMYFGTTDDYPTVLGVQLTAIIAAAIIVVALVLYTRYNDKDVVATINAHNAELAEAAKTEVALPVETA
jgi:Na+/melibiose symporter-like transporter